MMRVMLGFRLMKVSKSVPQSMSDIYQCSVVSQPRVVSNGRKRD